jgi:hypothetical protein
LCVMRSARGHNRHLTCVLDLDLKRDHFLLVPKNTAPPAICRRLMPRSGCMVPKQCSKSFDCLGKLIVTVGSQPVCNLLGPPVEPIAGTTDSF